MRFAIPGKTLPAILEAYVWASHWAYVGKWALLDHLGNPITEKHGKKRFAMRGLALAGPYSFAWTCNLGDWEWHAECWPGENHYRCDSCCDECGAHKKNAKLNFRDFSEEPFKV